MARSYTTVNDRAANTAIPALASTGTICFWIKPNFNSGDSGDHMLATWAKTGTTGSADGRVQIEKFSDNNMYVGALKVDVAGSDDRLVFADTGIFVNGTWAHHLLTWDQPNTTTRYFVNGVQKGTTSANPTHAFTVACTVGSVGNGPNSGWPASGNNGAIADAAFYSVVLTSGEISALAAGARPYTVRPGSLKWYLPLDGLVSPEPDLSGNAANATLTGTALASGPPVMMFTPRWPQFLGPVTDFFATLAAGLYSLTDNNETLLRKALMKAQEGAYSLTGEQVTSLSARLSKAQSGSYSLTGEQLKELSTRLAKFQAGAYSLTGEQILELWKHVGNIQAAYYSLTGESLTLSQAIVIIPFIPPSPPQLQALEAISKLFGVVG